METVETVEAIIASVGGPSAAAKLGRVGLPAVSNWKARGKIPAEQYFVFDDALRRNGKVADPSIFGFAPTEEAPQ